MFDPALDQRIRVHFDPAEEGVYYLVVGQMIVANGASREELESKATAMRAVLDGWMRGAWARYSVELRDRLGWRSGAGAETTLQQIVQMQKDYQETQSEVAGLRGEIEELESERDSMRDQLTIRIKQLEALRETAREYRHALRSIADHSHDSASKMIAGTALYEEG